MTGRIFRAIALTAVLSVIVCLLIFLSLIRSYLDISVASLLPEIALTFILSIACVLLISYAVASNSAKRFVKPLNEVDFDAMEAQSAYSELAPLIGRVKRQNDLIGRQMEALEKKQNEFRMITENMREGFLIADSGGLLVTYNSSALRLLGADGSVGRENIGSLSSEPEFQLAVKEAFGGTSTSKIIKIENRYCHIFVSPSLEDGRVTGIILIVLDVTEREQWEELRREFTSNVSHELKTPLTTIRGTAEIMLDGIVKPEDTGTFLKSIYDESSRLLTLIEDILKLSQLDEKTIGGEYEELDLYQLAAKVLKGLSAAAQRSDVTLELRGRSVKVTGVNVVLEEMIYNLTDNAVKYNKAGGSVTIEVNEIGGRPVLKVSDTGIGIPKEYIDRVFERFFRVDKSRSKAAGGTGLGLSIVKHAAAYHGAELKLESIENKGTTVTVLFQ
jgi:two-component system phosphate regulon sensor histidine kinase PhoR